MRSFHSDPNISRFLDDIANHPILTEAKERELIRLAQTGNRAAAHRLCVCNLKFVIMVAKGYRNLGIPFRDLVGEGVLGLIKAISRFNSAKGYRFTSYAVWWIRQAITMAIKDTSRTIRITSEHDTPIRRLRRSPLHQVIGGEYVEDLESIAKAHRVPARNLLASLQASYGGYRLDQPMTESGATLAEVLPTADPNPEEDAQAQSRLAILNRLRGKLLPIQREVVTLFYGLDDRAPLTLREIGYRTNLSHERIRQIRNEALARMKKLSRRFKE